MAKFCVVFGNFFYRTPFYHPLHSANRHENTALAEKYSVKRYFSRNQKQAKDIDFSVPNKWIYGTVFLHYIVYLRITVHIPKVCDTK